MRTWLAVVALTLVPLPLSAAAPEADTVSPNPLLQEWTTPFGVPPFDKIRNEHFLPAFEEAFAQTTQGDRRHRRGDRHLRPSRTPSRPWSCPASFSTRWSAVFSNLNSAETNETLQAVAKEVAPRRAALHDDIYLNDVLFQRVRTLIESRETLSLDPEATRLLEETFKEFVRSGATLGPKDKERLREINGELSVLTTRFGENLLAETNAYKLVVED